MADISLEGEGDLAIKEAAKALEGTKKNCQKYLGYIIGKMVT